MQKIIVRRTEQSRQCVPDDLHTYNIYIPNKEGYINLFTCMCCQAVFTRGTNKIDEPDEGLTTNDLPLNVIEHWYNQCKHYPFLRNALKSLLKEKKRKN